MELGNLPIIDWEQATKIAGNKRQLAEEMFDFFLKGLPNDVSLIKRLHQAQQYSELLREVHKLHGALCYCGLPRLKIVIATLESALRSNVRIKLPLLLDQLDDEAKLVINKHYSS